MLQKLLSPLTLFVLSSAFLVFLYGFVAAHFGLFPHAQLAPALDGVAKLWVGKKSHLVTPMRPNALVGTSSYDASGNEREPTAAEDEAGITIVASAWLEGGSLQPALRAIDRRGEVLHTWPIRVREIWPESPHDDAFAGELNIDGNYAHGMYLFENGDVLFNVEYLGLVRLNPAGEVVWRLDRRTHHSIYRADDGNFWVSGVRWYSDLPTLLQKFPGLIPPVAEDLVLEVSPDGEVLREISVVEMLWNSEHRSRFWSRNRRSGDVLHLNDVEKLEARMADEYPLFEAGDLIVSLRHHDLLVVFDPDTKAIRWSSDRPQLLQHDPDFIGGGWISVFDNRTDDSPGGQFLGGSNLFKVQPHTGAIERIYPRLDRPDPRGFYTGHAGKAQLLDNGHWVLTEAVAGRVLEVDAAGRVVWEWGQEPLPDGMIPEVHEGARYPISPAQARRWGAR